MWRCRQDTVESVITGETVRKGRGGRAPPIGLWNELLRRVWGISHWLPNGWSDLLRFNLIFFISRLILSADSVMLLDCWLPIITDNP